MEGGDDPYRTLGLTSGIIGHGLSDKTIKDAYVMKCRILKLQKRSGKYVDDKLEKVKKAYKFLCNRTQRHEFDRRLQKEIEIENRAARSSRPRSRRQKKKRKVETCEESDAEKFERECNHLLLKIHTSENNLRLQKSSGAKLRGPKIMSYEDKLEKAMRKMSLREANNDPSSDIVLNHQKRKLFTTGKEIYLLHEFACGYALFLARDFNEVDMENFESVEKYISKPQPLELKAFHGFSSPHEALVEMNAISKSTATEKLKSFLLEHLPGAVNGETNDYIAVYCELLSLDILRSTKLPTCSGKHYRNVMRALRMKFDTFVRLNPGSLKRRQGRLARLYSQQRCNADVRSSRVVPPSFQSLVVPHSFEGLFIARGRKKDIICTKNLVPGEACTYQSLTCEDLIYVEDEDGTKVEYRVWKPETSKLAAAIKYGVTNIWVKPGSRVLYMGDVSANTVFQLSDLVGLDGLVYVVGLCDNIVNSAKKRVNVIAIFEDPKLFLKYRMVVGTVDVIFADMAASHEVNHIVSNAIVYLKTGGHYMIATQVSNTNSASQDMFAHHHHRKEFKQIEVVTLGETGIMTIGCFRMLEEIELPLQSCE